jgi:hypothetical protein
MRRSSISPDPRRSILLPSLRRAKIQRALSCTTFLAFTAVFVVPQYALRAGVPVRPGEMTFGVGVSDEDVSASFDTIFPIAVPANGLLFLNPKLTTGDELDPRVSLGLGYRHLFEGSQIIVGANLFYDNFDSVHGNRINQIGVGAEVLTRWVDFRANLYLPEQNRHRIDEKQTVDISRTSSSSSQALGPRVTGQDLRFQGYNILQSTTGLNETQTTINLRETETTRFWERYEAGMRGADAEIGFLVPGVDRYADVRLFGGYYYFNNDFGGDIEGFKGRLEVRAVPAVTFDAMYYDDKEVIGSNWFYGVRVSAPFDLANLSNGRSPFAGFTEAFKPKGMNERENFARRMTENVMRTSRVSTSESKFIKVREQKEVSQDSTTYVTSTPYSSTTLLSLGGAPITVTHANSTASGPGNGTIEAPYLTLALVDADLVKRNIILLHADSTFTGSITLMSGQQFLGEANGITHLINSDQGLLALPRATNGVATPVVSNPAGTIIYAASNTVLAGLNLTSAAVGIDGPAGGGTNITVRDSTIRNMTTAGVRIVPSTNTTIDNVVFANNATDTILNAFNTTITDVTSTGAINGAISLANTTGTTTLTNVNISGAGGFGIQVTNPGGTHNFTNVDITGGTGLGLTIHDGAGAFAIDSTSSIVNTGNTAFRLQGSAASVTSAGTITQATAARAADINGQTGGAVAFNGTVSGLTSSTGVILQNSTGGSVTFADLDLGGAGVGQRLLSDAVTVQNNTGGTFTFTDVDIFTAGARGFVALNNTGTSAINAGVGSTIHSTGATALALTNTIAGASGLNFGSIASANSPTNGATLVNVSGLVGLGNLTSTGAVGNGLAVQNSSASVGATSITVAGSGITADGILLAGNTGPFTVTGLTNITAVKGDGIDLTGLTANPTVTFGATTISGFGAANAGINFAGANVTARFGLTSIQNGGLGTGVDLSSTQGTRAINFATGSSITHVRVGVQLSSSHTSATTANANLTFGDGSGTDANGRNSTINATTTVDALGLTPTGTYNFLDVNFTGTAGFPSGPGAFFVTNKAATGGDGTFANPFGVSEADAVTTGNITFAFLDGTYNFATLNAGTAFNLGASQSVTGLDNGNVVSFGTAQPLNVSGNFGVTGSTASRQAGGSLSLTNGAAAAVFSLLGSNTVTNLTLTGEAGAVDPTSLFTANGAAPGFNNASGMSMSGLTLGNLQAGSTAFAFTGLTGNVSIQNNNINVPNGQLLALTGGTAVLTLTKGTGANLVGGSVGVQNTTGGSVAVTGANLTPGVGVAGISLANNGAALSFSNVAITTTTGTGIAATGANSSVTVSGTNNPGAAATAFSFANTSGSYNYAGLTSAQSGIGLAFDNTHTGAYNLGSLTVNGAPGAAAFFGTGTAANLTLASLTVNNAAGLGLSLNGDTGSFAVTGTTTVNSTAGDAIRLAGAAGTYAFNGVNITGAGQDGIDLSGLSGNQNVTFGITGINGFGAANSGISFTGADVTASFGVTTIQNGGNGTGLDLSSTQNTRAIAFAKGSSIANVNIGVQLSASGTTATTANASLVFGDGEGVIDKASTISATTTVAAIGLLVGSGSYDFDDVLFTGTPGFPVGPGALFVSAAAVNGAGVGTFVNPFSVADADAITTANVTFAFLDGTYNFATLNAGAPFTLGTNQALTGLDNGNAISFGLLQPVHVFGDFGSLGASVTRANTGNGTLSITNGGPTSIFDLAGSSIITNVSVTGEAGALDPVILVGSTAAVNTGGITLNGVTLANLQAGATALNFAGLTGNVSIQGNNINTSAGALLSINGGTATYTIAKGTLPGGAIPGTFTGANITVQNTTGGSVTITDAALSTNGNTAVTLNGNAATVTLTNLAITRTANDTAFDIDAGAPSTATVIIDGTSTLDSTAGSAFVIGAGARNITAGTIAITNNNTTAGSVVSVTGQTGGTLSFGTVAITGFGNAGTDMAVSLAGTAGTVSFTDLDITTTNGAGLNVGGITLAPGASPTINATGATALTMNGTTLSAGAATFASVSATNTAGSTGISLTNITGATTLTTIAISNAGAPGIGFDNAGTVTINGGSINGTGGGYGAAFINTAFTLNSLSIGATAATLNDGVYVEMSDGVARTSSIGGLTTNLVAGTAVNFNNFGAGVQTFTIANSTLNSTGSLGLRVLINAAGGNVNVTANNNTITQGGLLMDAQGAPGTLTITSFLNNNVVKASSSGMQFRQVTFDADLGTAGFQQVSGGNTTIGNALATTDVTGFGLRLFNSKGSVGFGTLNIHNDTGTGLYAAPLPGDSLTLSNTAGVISTTNGAALDITRVALNSTFASVSSTNAFTDGIALDTVSGTANMGNVSVTNATGAGIRFAGSSAAVTAGTVTVNGAATGLLFGSNTGGSFTPSGATSLTNITTTGISANAATGTYTLKGLTIGFAGATANSRGIDLRGSNVQFETDNLGITGNGTATSIAIDLSGTSNPNGANSATPNILLAKDTGEIAAISNVATGVKMGEAGNSAGAYFRFGNQTPAGSGGSGSSIAVIGGGTTLDTTNLTSTDGFTQGRYEFTGVTFTGNASFQTTTASFFFVASSGTGDGSTVANAANAATLVTQLGLSNLANKTIVLINDGAPISLGAATANLNSLTTIDGFGNGNSISAFTVPINVIVDAFTGTIADPTGNGAATLTANAGNNVIELNNSHTIRNINLTGGSNLINESTTFANLTVAGVQLTGAGTGVFNFAAATGVVTVTDANNVINSATPLLTLGGGNAAVTISKGTGALTARGISISGTTGGSVTVNGANLTDSTGTGVSITNSAGTFTFGAATVISNAADAAFSVSGGTANVTYDGHISQANNSTMVRISGGHSTGTIAFNTGSLHGTNGTGLQFDNADGTYNFNGATMLNGSVIVGIEILNGSGGTFTFGALTHIISPTSIAYREDTSTAGVTYNGTITQDNAANAVRITGKTGGTTTFAGLVTANTTTAAAVDLMSNTGGTVNFTGGLNITTTSGRGFHATGGGTISVLATAGDESVTTTTGTAVNIANTTIGASGVSFDSVTVGAAVNGVNLDMTSGGAVALGTVGVTSATTGLRFVGSSNAVSASSLTINGSGVTTNGVVFGTNTGGSFIVSGAASITNIAGNGIDANAATGSYTFAGLTIGFSGAGRGIDLRNSNVTSFTAGNTTITGNESAGSIAIDLSGSLFPGGQPVSGTPNIQLATGALQTAVISNVGTGVQLGNGVAGSAHSFFRYGNQVTVPNSGSSIDVIAGGFTIDTTNLTNNGVATAQEGRYEFSGVTYGVGDQASFEGTNPNFIFVSAAGTGTASGANPTSAISTATFLATQNTAVNLANKTVVFVNDGASINLGATTLNAGTNTSLLGFGNLATVTVPGGTIPANVIGSFTPGGGNFTSAGGAATVISSTSTITLNTGNTLGNFILGSATTALTGTNFGTLTINGMVINNTTGAALSLNTGTLAGTGFTSITSTGGTNAVSLTAVAGTALLGTGSLSGASGATFNVSGGTAVITYNGTITQNNAANAVSIANKTAGSTTFGGLVTANTGTATGINLVTNAGSTVNFNGGLNIDTTSGIGFNAIGGGTVAIAATGGDESVTTTAGGTAVSLSGITIGGSGITFDFLTANGTSANSGIILNNTGAGTFTVSGATAVDARTVASIDIDNTVNALFSATTVTNRGGIGIDIDAHAGISGFGATTISGAGAASAAIDSATSLSGSAITFFTTSISGSTGPAITLTNNTGNFSSFGGTITNSTGDEVVVSGGTGSVDIGANITNSTGRSANLSGRGVGAAGITLSGTINDTGTGILVQNNTAGTFTFSGTTKILGTTSNQAVTLTNNTGATINYTGGGLAITTTSGLGFGAIGGGTIAVTGTGNTITTVTGQILSWDGVSVGASGVTFATLQSTGTVASSAISLNNVDGAGDTFSGGNVTVAATSGATSDGLAITGGSAATFTFASAAIGTAVNTIGRHGIRLDGANGPVTFTTLDIDGTVGSGMLVNASTSAVTINGGTIGATADAGNASNAAFAVTAAGANVTYSGSLINSTGRAILVQDTTAGTVSFGGAGTTFTDSGTGIEIAGAAGNVTLSFANTTVSGNGILVQGSATQNASATFTFNNMALGNAVSGTMFRVTNNGANRLTGSVLLNNVDLTSTDVDRTVLIEGLGTNGTVTFDGASVISATGGTNNGILVQNNNTGTNKTITFNGAITATAGGNTAINLAANTGTTINFTGGLNLTTTSGVGFSATGGGTVTVQGAVNTISSTTGTALTVTSTNIGLLGLTFRSIASNGAANGILLNNTGSSGGLIVTGDGTAASNGSGGSIQNSTGAGISLTSTSNVSLNQMNIQNGGNDGITGTTVTGFTLSRSNVTANGNADEEHGIDFANLFGTVVISDSLVRGSFEHNFKITNTSGTLDSLNIKNSTFDHLSVPVSPAGGNGVLIVMQGTSVLTKGSISGSTFRNNFSNGVLVNSENTSRIGDDNAVFGTTNGFVVASSTFDDNNISIQFGQFNSSDLTVDIQGNTIINDNRRGTSGPTSTSHAIVVGSSAIAGAGSSLNARIDGNIIGSTTFAGSGSSIGSGIRVIVQGLTDATIVVNNNTIREAPGGFGMELNFLGPQDDAGTVPVSDITVTNNNVDHRNLPFNPGTSDFPLPAIYLNGDNQGATAAGAPTVRAQVTGNTVPTSGTPYGFTGAWLEVFEYTGSSPGILQLVDTGAGSASATAELTSNNTGMAAANAQVSLIAGPITLPPDLTPLPLMFAGSGTSGSGSNPPLTQTALNTLSSAAITMWSGTGLTAQQTNLLNGITFGLADLGPGYLGEASGTTVLLSSTAAGHSWFIDTTPLDDSEFTGSGLTLEAISGGEAAGRVDALSVLLHEIGHVLGYDNGYGSGVGGPLMEGDLGLGIRLLPEPNSALLISAPDRLGSSGAAGDLLD